MILTTSDSDHVGARPPPALQNTCGALPACRAPTWQIETCARVPACARAHWGGAACLADKHNHAKGGGLAAPSTAKVRPVAPHAELCSRSFRRGTRSGHGTSSDIQFAFTVSAFGARKGAADDRMSILMPSMCTPRSRACTRLARELTLFCASAPRRPMQRMPCRQRVHRTAERQAGGTREPREGRAHDV